LVAPHEVVLTVPDAWLCALTFAPTRGRARLLTEVRRPSPVAVGRAVRAHYPATARRNQDAADRERSCWQPQTSVAIMADCTTKSKVEGAE
jgi:hypothetical protein